jgi:hypothetical protein
MCVGDAEEPASEDPIVVPVPVVDDDKGEDGDGDDWCCEYKDGDEATQYAITDGPAECNTKYAAQDGRWISGTQCIPCCCKTPNDAEDAEKGDAFELTTPKSCSAASGECLAGDAEECGGETDKAKEAVTKPAPKRRPGKLPPKTVTKPAGN